MVVEVVNQLDITLQPVGNFSIERVEACAASLLAQEIVQAIDSLGERNQGSTNLQGSLLDLFDLLDTALLEVHERAAKKLGIFHRSFVRFRGLDVGLHNFQVPPGEIPSKGRRGNQMSPRVPAIHERFRDDIWSEKKLFVVHFGNCSISTLGHTKVQAVTP